MTNVRKKLADEDLDNLRINLSVRKDKLSPEPVCDFCGSPDPVFIYAAISDTDRRPWWRWCACTFCAEAVENNNLEQRLVECFAAKLRVPRQALLNNIKDLLRDFSIA